MPCFGLDEGSMVKTKLNSAHSRHRFVPGLVSVVSLCLSLFALITIQIRSNSDFLASKTQIQEANFRIINDSMNNMSMTLNKLLNVQDIKKEDNHTMFVYKTFTPVSVHTHLMSYKPNVSNVYNGVHSMPHYSLELSETLATDHARGVDLADDAIVIKYTGLYYVYSNVHIEARKYFGEQSLFSYLHVFNPNDPRRSGVLMRSSLTFPTFPSNALEVKESCFIGGIYQLFEGEQVTVCLSNESTAEVINKDSFVGLFMLAANGI